MIWLDRLLALALVGLSATGYRQRGTLDKGELLLVVWGVVAFVVVLRQGRKKMQVPLPGLLLFFVSTVPILWLGRAVTLSQGLPGYSGGSAPFAFHFAMAVTGLFCLLPNFLNAVATLPEPGSWWPA